MADYQQNFLASLQGGLNFGRQVKGIRDQNQLAQLASQGYGASEPAQQQSLLGQMAAIDPVAAQQQQKTFANDEDRRNRTMANMAQLLVNAPEQSRAGLYQRMVPTLSQFGLSDLPQQYDAHTAPIIDQAARAIYQAYSGGGSASGVQSTYINRAGQRVAIMRDGSQQVLGDADARTQLRDQEGVAPSIVDLRTGQASPLREAGAAPQGVYIDPSLPPEVQAGIRQAEASGIPYTGQTVAQAGTGLAAARPDSSMQITPYQQAQLVRQDRADARADMAAMDARDARGQAAEARQLAAQQKAQQAQQAINTRQAQLADVRRGVERVRAALGALDQSRIGTGPIAQASQRFLPAGQELETAVNAMNNSMLALTRVPGIGAQSDLEARIASMRFPQLDREESVNRRTLADLEAFVNDLSRTAQQSDAQDRQSIQAAGAGPAAGGSPAQGGGAVQVRSAADYDALPAGALYIAPDGTQRRKR